jgi:prolyl-tRNA editing enzyme YbaK/EbsC (Cys-tRNA(Pro) deacylase)
LRGPEDETTFSAGDRRFIDVTGVRHFPQGTRTAQEAADAIGVQIGQIVKALVFRLAEPDRPLLILTSGANRVDTDHVGALLAGRLEKADADYVREQSGFAIGGVPPFGWRGASPVVETLVDEDLLAFDEVWAAAGTPTAVFPIAPRDLIARTGGRVVTVVRP